MDFYDKEILKYAEQHSQPEPELLVKLNRETNQKIMSPRMLSGHLQGRILSMLSKLINPKNILEIGTYTGYSALCLAEGLQEDGYLHTIDNNEELYDFQRKYFDQSWYGGRIVQHLGNALEVIPKLEVKFDLVFIDADKENYPNYLNAVIPKLNPGALVLSDNVLWSGKVISPLKPNDKVTKILMEYNQMLNNHPKFESVLLPIRDGITLSRFIG